MSKPRSPGSGSASTSGPNSATSACLIWSLVRPCSIRLRMNSRWRSAWGENAWLRGTPHVGHMTSSSMSGSDACGAPAAATAKVAMTASAAATASSDFITETVPPPACGGTPVSETAKDRHPAGARRGRRVHQTTGERCVSRTNAWAIRSPRVLKRRRALPPTPSKTLEGGKTCANSENSSGQRPEAPFSASQDGSRANARGPQLRGLHRGPCTRPPSLLCRHASCRDGPVPSRAGYR